MNTICIVIINLGCFLNMHLAFGQTKGKVEYDHLGISFVIPEGWVGQEMEAGYLIGSDSEAGFAFLTTHQYNTVQQLRQQAQQGIFDQAGTQLMLAGNIEDFGSSGIGAEFSGTLEGQAARAYILGLINEHGDGVTIMSAASPDLYSQKHKNLALNLAESIKFSKPVTPPVVKEWEQTLQNAKLTYMNSYYSSGGGVDIGGTVYSSGGGYSDQVEIHLCAQGFFKYKSSSSTTIDNGGFGSSFGSGKGNGTWEVVANAQRGATLRLNFYNGEIYEYVLAYEDKKTLLNGKRYYRTYASSGPDYAPDCFQ